MGLFPYSSSDRVAYSSNACPGNSSGCVPYNKAHLVLMSQQCLLLELPALLPLCRS